MDQAVPAVCFADSDEDDYVSFDEEELNTGIANLYDDDSASDYNDDSCEDDIEEEIDQLQEVLQAAPAPAPAPQQQQQQQQQEPLDFLFSAPSAAAAPVQQQQQQSAAFSFAAAAPPAPQQANNGGGGGFFANLFGGSSSNNRSSAPVRRSSIEALESAAAPMSAYSANRSSAAPARRKKKSKTTQLHKRIHRLQQHQHERKERKARSGNKPRSAAYRKKVNTNIISIDLGTLKSAADNVATGDAIVCSQCRAMLSKHDALLKELDDFKLDDEDDSIWVCAFCNKLNVINVDAEEVPVAETVDYLVAPAPSLSDESKTNEQSGDTVTAEKQIIFCVDVSGSMCVSQQIDAAHAKFKLRGSRAAEEREALSQFVEHNAQRLNVAQDTQYVSRLQCVQTAVDAQISSLAKTKEPIKCGLVSFNDSVTVIGDGTDTHEVITGDKLGDLAKLKEIGTACAVGKRLSECHEKLSDALWALKENGQTALGPALVVSIAMASSVPGSQVILCTDGLANIGVGALDAADAAADEQAEDDDAMDPMEAWYTALGEYAVGLGVVVNIVSIADDGCKLELLGSLVEATGGNLKRINPLKLAEKFEGIIEDESIATNCAATMLLHPGLKFHDTVEAAQIEKDDDEAAKVKKASEAKSEPAEDVVMADKAEAEDNDEPARKIFSVARSLRDVGNVFAGSRIFFEYVVDKAKKAEFAGLKQLPFQVQIEYQKKDGSRWLRVITQQKSVTMDRAAMRQQLDYNLLSKYGTHVTTELCAKGDYESSRAWTAANTTFMNQNVNNHRQMAMLANYAQQNVVLDHQMQRQMQTESMAMPAMAMNAMAMHDEVEVESRAKKSRGKKKKARKGARNDLFSSHMYKMKKSSRK